MKENLTFGTAAWNMKLLKGFIVELVAFNVMFTTWGVLLSFSKLNSTFRPSLSTAIMGGIDDVDDGAPAKRGNTINGTTAIILFQYFTLVVTLSEFLLLQPCTLRGHRDLFNSQPERSVT